MCKFSHASRLTSKFSTNDMQRFRFQSRFALPTVVSGRHKLRAVAAAAAVVR